MFKSVRVKLLFILLSFGFVSLLVFTGFFLIQQEKQHFNNFEKRILDFELLALRGIKNINAYFTYDTKNANYFISHHSIYLNNYRAIFESQRELSNHLIEQNYYRKIEIESGLQTILELSDSLNAKLDQITYLILLRGFKDFGVEGIMRQHAHNLERIEEVDLKVLLMLRRHEKDYIIRNEAKYISSFNDRIDKYFDTIQESDMNSELKSKIQNELKLYKANFNEMVVLDTRIGIKNNSALKSDLEILVTEITRNTNLLNKQCFNQGKIILKRYHFFSVVIVLSMILIGVYFSFSFSKLLTQRISILSEYISKFIDSCFTFSDKIPVKIRNDEVGKLVENFELMRQKITDQINYFEVKVAERTEEINTQKEQILSQNNKLIDSLRYAVNIQEALLPNHNYLKKNIADYFVMFRPKDLVSGDFYWYKQMKNKSSNLSIIAIVDCTGHGIPGAFMSMLGIAFLNDVVIKKEVKTSADILDQLRIKVLDNLAQQNNGRVINDGMDVALAVIDHKNMKLQFSGAYRDLYLIRKGELIVLKGDKMPIGKYISDAEKFAYNEIEILKNDLIYMFTDGFADQEGGIKGKKFLRKNLKKLLMEINKKPLGEQKKMLNNEFNQWKRNYNQTDDVLVAGFKI